MINYKKQKEYKLDISLHAVLDKVHGCHNEVINTQINDYHNWQCTVCTLI